MRNKNLDYSRYAAQIAAQPYWDPTRALIARTHRLVTYKDYCETHGETDHSTNLRTCVECLRDDRTLPRAEARRLGFATFWDYCDEHGWCGHHIQCRKCAQCFTTAGMRRNPRESDPVRVAARQAGDRTFRRVCEVHGETDHHTQTGKCLTCYNAVGYPRPGTLDASVRAG